MGNRRLQIESLASRWSRIDEAHAGVWRPFGTDALLIKDISISPVDEIAIQRRTPASRGVSLDSRCIAYLTEVWSGSAIDADALSGDQHWHAYRISSNASWNHWKKDARNLKSKENIWWADNLLDAARKYSWHESRVGGFASISLALQHALRAGDEVNVAAVCQIILRWGGVEKRGKRFLEWVYSQAERETLCELLVDATRRLIPNSSLNLEQFDGKTYFMDSSSTKVYSALALDLTDGIGSPKQDVLIYDGRVAGAIALVTKRLLAASGFKYLPDQYKFPVERPYGSSARRNPSTEEFRFPSFAYGTAQAAAATHFGRACYARFASSVIQVVLGVNKPSSDFIECERGLFMVGYDLNRL
jgi:hypothetical protein